MSKSNPLAYFLFTITEFNDGTTATLSLQFPTRKAVDAFLKESKKFDPTSKLSYTLVFGRLEDAKDER